MKIKATIIKQIYAKDDFRILACVPDQKDTTIQLSRYGNFTIVGELAYLSVGKSYELELEVNRNDSKYGVSYKVVSVPSFARDGQDEITDDNELELLCQITTPAQAKYVHDAYPNYIRLVLAGKESEIDVKKIYNVREFRHHAYVEAINTRFKYYQIVLNLKEYAITLEEATKLGKHYATNEEVYKALQTSPYYVLVEFLNRSFDSADKLLLSLRPELKNSEERAIYLMIYVLNDNELKGNTCMDANEMAAYCNSIAPELVPKLKSIATDTPLLYYDDETKTIAIMSTYISECNIASNIQRRLHQPHVLDIDWRKYQNDKEYQMTDEQTRILDLAVNQDVAILVGNSGTGKTSSVKALIRMLEDNRLTYTLLAPTGIAAKRLHESTGRQACTIHRQIMGGGNVVTDFLIVDEISMVGVNLLSTLLDNTLSETKLIFVGDDGQLASISCGNVIKDMLDSNMIPTARLTRVFRYGTQGITTVATDIRKGKYYLDSEGEPVFENAHKVTDYRFVPMQDDPLNQVVEIYASLLEKYKIQDVLVLSPFNIGDVGTYAINRAIQSIYNPPREGQLCMTYKRSGHEIIFRVGDKVINKVNTYSAKTLEKYEYEQKVQAALRDEIDDTSLDDAPTPTSTAQVMNGDIGYVRKITDKYMVVQFDENLVVFEKSDLNHLMLGYCLSVHSVQGSQAKAVILVTHPSHQKMMTRNLLYVGATRCQDTLIQLATPDVINESLDINETNNRKTLLKNLLETDTFSTSV